VTCPFSLLYITILGQFVICPFSLLYIIIPGQVATYPYILIPGQYGKKVYRFPPASLNAGI